MIGNKMDFKKACKTSAKQYRAYEEKRARLISEGVHDYSLIHSLLKSGNEVQLHSNFIYSFINPQGLHYRGDIFLGAFLNQISLEWSEFIDVRRATVYKERNNIDLMITDGDRYVIIENKIHAVDQKYQISRYIQTVMQLASIDKHDAAERIAVIYLSSKKSKPSDDSQSIIGFDLVEESSPHLVWRGFSNKEQEELKNTKYRSLIELDLADGSKIPYYHFPYYSNDDKCKCGTLEGWVYQCIKILEDTAGKNDLIYALEEYGKILQRLKKPRNKWKKIMDLVERMLELQNENAVDHDDVYKLMIASRDALPRYVAARIYRLLKSIFVKADIERDKGRFEKGITEDSLVDWLRKNGQEPYHIGFVYMGHEITFAKIAAYIKPEGENYSKEYRICKDHNDTRLLLLSTPDGLNKFESEVRKVAEEKFKLVR
jgi:hypothetical protein